MMLCDAVKKKRLVLNGATNYFTFTEGTMTTHLKVVRVCSDPSTVSDHQVPVFIDTYDLFRSEQWDLTTQQVFTFFK